MAIFKLADLAGNESVYNEKYILYMSDKGSDTTEFTLKYPFKNEVTTIVIDDAIADIIAMTDNFIACENEGTDIALDKSKILSAVDSGTGSLVTYDAEKSFAKEILIDIDTDALVA